mgnify:CR=1 FL=1
MYLTVPIAKLRDFCNMVAEGCVCSELDVQTRHLNHDFFSIGIQYRIGIIIKQRLLARTESDTCYFINIRQCLHRTSAQNSFVLRRMSPPGDVSSSQTTSASRLTNAKYSFETSMCPSLRRLFLLTIPKRNLPCVAVVEGTAVPADTGGRSLRGSCPSGHSTMVNASPSSASTCEFSSSNCLRLSSARAMISLSSYGAYTFPRMSRKCVSINSRVSTSGFGRMAKNLKRFSSSFCILSRNIPRTFSRHSFFR